MTQIGCFDLIAQLVIDLTLETEDVIAEIEVHDLCLRLRLEYTSQILQVFDLTIEQQLVVWEFIVLIASHIPLYLERYAMYKMLARYPYFASTMKNSLVLMTLK